MKEPKKLDSLKKDRKINVSDFVNPEVKKKEEEILKLEKEALDLSMQAGSSRQAGIEKEIKDKEDDKVLKKEGFWSKFKEIDRKKKIAIIVTAIILFIFIVTALFYVILRLKQQRGGYTGNAVNLEVSSLTEVGSGSTITYIIEFSNKEKVKLKNSELSVLYPEGFTFESSDLKPSNENNSVWRLGDLESGYEGKINITGKIIGKAGDNKLVTVTLKFIPEGINTEFQKSASWNVIISKSPILLSIDVPKNMASGNVMNISINYENKGDILEDVELRLEYPRGFTYESAIPQADRDNKVWTIGDLDKFDKGEIKIRGTIVGDLNEEKVFRVRIGTTDNKGEFSNIIEAEDRVKIVQPAIILNQTVNGKKEAVANPGDELSYEIKYKNTGNVGISNAIITATISPSLIDEDTINVEGGAYSSGKITWKSSGISGLSLLRPNDEGSVSFKVKIKDTIPIKSESDKNFQIISKSTITSSDIPEVLGSNKTIESNTVIVKISSKLTLFTEGRYYDYDGTQLGSGPLPPQVGKKTTYKIYLKVVNLTNDVENAEVITTLPAGIGWTGNYTVSHGKGLTYNPDSGKIIWNIGLVPANIGRFSKPIEAVFEISIIPSAQQVGQTPILIDECIIRGKDSFAGVDLENTAAEITTELENDRKAKGKGEVVK